MKRETLRHPKMHDLCSRLDCKRVEALGYLQLLWDFTGEQAPRGDIGKFPDGAIARGCDWQGDASVFIDALVGAGFIDVDPTHRLLIHNWEKHCERWVKSKLATMQESFASQTVSRHVSRDTSQDISPDPPRDQTKPNQTNPIQTPARTALPPCLDTPEFKSAFEDWQVHRKQHRTKLTPKALEGAIEKLAALGCERAVAAIRHSIANGYQGLYEPNDNRVRAGPGPSRGSDIKLSEIDLG